MPKETNYTVRSFLIVDDNTVFSFENLTSEQKNEYIPRIMKNVGRAGSDYLSCHLNEAEVYLGRKRCEVIKDDYIDEECKQVLKKGIQC